MKSETRNGESEFGLAINLNTFKITNVLWGITAAFVAIHVLGIVLIEVLGAENIWTLRFFELFHLDREQNLAAGFSVLLLLFASMLLCIITFFKWKEEASFRKLWALLAVGFSFMAVDEAWSFHERLVKPVRAMTHNDLPAIFHFAWVLPAVALLLVLAVVFFKFLVKLKADTRKTFLLAAFLYVGGAVGMEMIGGDYAASEGQNNLGYFFFTSVEEILEMGGVIIFIGGLLRYICNNLQYLKLNFLSEKKSPAPILQTMENRVVRPKSRSPREEVVQVKG